MDREHQTFVDRMAQSAESDGMSPIAGRLFALLLLSAEPRSLDDLAAELGVSKASVSTDARRLLDRKIVERITRSGDRRDYYELAPNFFAQVVRARVARWHRVHELVAPLRRGRAQLAPVVRQRIAAIEEINMLVDRLETALTDWERPHAAAGRR